MQPPMHSAAVAPIPTPVVVVDSRQSGAQKYYAEGGRATGWIILVCGVIAIILNIISLVRGSPVAVIGVGIWGGLLFFIPTGILGVCSYKKNTCVIVAYMVMAILSSLEGFVVFIMGMTAAFVSSDQSYCSYNSYGCNTSGLVAMDALLSVTGFIAFITSIVGACFCCGGVCCGRYKPPAQSVIHYYSGGPQAAMVVTSMSPQNQQFGTSPGFGQHPAMSTYPRQQEPYPSYPGPYTQHPGHYPHHPGPYPPQPQHPGLSYAPPVYQPHPPSSSTGGYAPDPSAPKEPIPASPPPQYEAIGNEGYVHTVND